MPLRRELEELFKLVGRWDRERFQESLTGRERSLYRPLVGWSGTMHNSGNIELDPGAIDAVLGAYADGKAGEVNAYKWEWNFEGCMI